MPGYYQGLLRQDMPITEDDVKTIEKDVIRTKNCHKLPSKYRFVENVLLAFTKRNPKIGYLQGFNFAVDFLWEKGFDEEAAFWILCHLNENLIDNKFFENLMLVFVDVKLFKYFLYNVHKKLFSKIMANGIDLFFVIHKWFLVNFLNIRNLQVHLISCRRGCSTFSCSTRPSPSSKRLCSFS